MTYHDFTIISGTTRHPKPERPVWKNDDELWKKDYAVWESKFARYHRVLRRPQHVTPKTALSVARRAGIVSRVTVKHYVGHAGKGFSGVERHFVIDEISCDEINDDNEADWLDLGDF